VKDQYFGDLNDYRKYGLIRSILSASGLRTLVAWMLARDDPSTDGQTIGYLDQPERWAGFDPKLFRALQTALRQNPRRHVGLIEKTNLLPHAEYFSAPVPDSAPERVAWFETLYERAKDSELIFLDPDNGLEVKSRPYGRKDSSKYLYMREVAALWSLGKSMLIYQHFPRVNRIATIQCKMAELLAAAPGSFLEALTASRVVFFLVLQPRHRCFHAPIVQRVQSRWRDQIRHWDLNR
jgi:hypothetical protein